MSDNSDPQASFDLSVVVETDKALASLRALHAEALATDATLLQLKKDALDAANASGVSIGVGGKNAGKAQIGSYQNVSNMFGGQNLGTTASALPQLAQAIGAVIARELHVVQGAGGAGGAGGSSNLVAQVQAVQNAMAQIASPGGSAPGSAPGGSTSGGGDAHQQLMNDALDALRVQMAQLNATLVANTQAAQAANANPAPTPSAQAQSSGASTTAAAPSLPPPILPAQPTPAPAGPPTQAAQGAPGAASHAGQAPAGPVAPSSAPAAPGAPSSSSGAATPAPSAPAPTTTPAPAATGLGRFMESLAGAIKPSTVSAFARAGADGPVALAGQAGSSMLESALPLLMDNPIAAAVTGIAAVAGGAAIGVSGEQATNRTGAEALSFNTAGSRTSAIGNTTDRQYQSMFQAQQVGQNFNYSNDVAQRAALQMGLAGQTNAEIIGPQGNGNLASALAFSRISGGQVSTDQAAGLTSTLAVQGANTPAQIDRIFQDLVNGAKVTGQSVGKLAATFADFTTATNGAAVSVAGLTAVQGLMGRGVNAGQVMAPIMNATGSDAFQTAGLLGISVDHLKKIQVSGNIGGAYDALGAMAQRYKGNGSTANEDTFLAAVQNTGLVDLSHMNAKRKYTWADQMFNMDTS